MLKIIITEGPNKWEIDRHLCKEDIGAIRIGEAIKFNYKTEIQLKITPGYYRIIDKIHEIESGIVILKVKKI